MSLLLSMVVVVSLGGIVLTSYGQWIVQEAKEEGSEYFMFLGYRGRTDEGLKTFRGIRNICIIGLVFSLAVKLLGGDD